MKNVLLMMLAAALLPAFSVLNTGYQVGDTATDFRLKNVDGQLYSLSDIPNAKGYIVVFTCNVCPYAKGYEQRIIELHQKYAPQGYPVVAINPNDPAVQSGDSFEEMQKLAKEHTYPFLYLFDERQEVYPVYGATKTPHVFLLDKNRVVKYIGAIDDSPEDAAGVEVPYLANAIEALKMGKEPDPSVTRAIGCGIKRKKS
jgi:peroxiredoxin